jgi:hypothetical protein
MSLQPVAVELDLVDVLFAPRRSNMQRCELRLYEAGMLCTLSAGNRNPAKLCDWSGVFASHARKQCYCCDAPRTSEVASNIARLLRGLPSRWFSHIRHGDMVLVDHAPSLPSAEQ